MFAQAVARRRRCTCRNAGTSERISSAIVRKSKLPSAIADHVRGRARRVQMKCRNFGCRCERNAITGIAPIRASAK